MWTTTHGYGRKSVTSIREASPPLVFVSVAVARLYSREFATFRYSPHGILLIRMVLASSQSKRNLEKAAPRCCRG